MRKIKLAHVKTVMRNGKPYVYFDTGGKKDGKPAYVRLPDPSLPQFGTAYSQALAARNRRQSPVDGMLTLPKFVDMFQRSPKFDKLSEGSQRIYRIYLDKLADQFDTFPADKLERKDVVGLADSLASTPSAANMLVRVTSALYVWGRKRGHVTARPCDDIDLFEEGEHKPWPIDLLNEALVSEDERIRVPVALMYYTALRIGDVCTLQWSNIRAGHVHVVPQKTKRQKPDGLTFPVHSELKAVLATVPRRGLCIFTKPDGTAWASNSVRQYIQAWAKKRGHEIVPHGLRKNAVNSLLEAGNSAAETASISGQSLQVVEHYAKMRNQATLGTAAILRWEAKNR